LFSFPWRPLRLERSGREKFQLEGIGELDG